MWYNLLISAALWVYNQKLKKMEKLITIIFDSEERAIEASKAIEQLAVNKDIAVAELYIISKNEEGNVSVRDSQNKEISHSIINTLADGVIGLLGGPLTVLAGLTKGAFSKRINNRLRYSKVSKILQNDSRTITAGKTAIVAHIDEYWDIPLSMAIEPFDVKVKRFNIAMGFDGYIIEKEKDV